MTHALAFLGVSAVVIVTPGQDTALTIRNSLRGRRRAGVATAAGVATGQACWTIATSAGLAALLAAYLVSLGAQTLLRAFLRRQIEHVARRPATPRGAFRQGVLSNLGNPKMAIFFTSLLPQFGTSFAAMLALGLVFCVMTFVWLTAYGVAVAKAGDVLRRPRVRRVIDAVTGAVLAVFGVRLALER